ncbi:unnamed protein product, partial [Amoebophrya sp. A25]|eukprot:GSA25T00008966001.1
MFLFYSDRLSRLQVLKTLCATWFCCHLVLCYSYRTDTIETQAESSAEAKAEIPTKYADLFDEDDDMDEGTQPLSPNPAPSTSFRKKNRFFLCVFVPVTGKSKKDVELSHVQMETWMRHGRSDARAFFVGDVLSEKHRSRTISIVGDDELPYPQLPVRTFKMWTYLGIGDLHLGADQESGSGARNYGEDRSRHYNRTGILRRRRPDGRGSAADYAPPSATVLEREHRTNKGVSRRTDVLAEESAAGVRMNVRPVRNGRRAGASYPQQNADTGATSNTPSSAADFAVDIEDRFLWPTWWNADLEEATSTRRGNPGLPEDVDEDGAADDGSSRDSQHHAEDDVTLEDIDLSNQYEGLVPHTAYDTQRQHFWSPPFSEQVSCDYYMKADPDSYVNVPQVIERLQCFPKKRKAYLGVVHAVAPTEDTALFFGHGGSGYMITKSLLPLAAKWSVICLSELIKSSDGVGMEDVLFSRCLRDHGNIGVESYGHTYTEFILNFHQAQRYILNGTRLMHGVDLIPPPLHKCTLVAHPIERSEDLRLAHTRVKHFELMSTAGAGSGGGAHDTPGGEASLPSIRAMAPPHIRIPRGGCKLQPFTISTQAEVRISKGEESMFVWNHDQMRHLYKCFRGSRKRYRCRDEAIVDERYYGLKAAPYGDESAHECKDACCESLACAMWLYRENDGCWLGHQEVAEKGKSVYEPGWIGGIKVLQRFAQPVELAQRVRASVRYSLAAQDALLDCYGHSDALRTFVERSLDFGTEPNSDGHFDRQLWAKFSQLLTFESSSCVAPQNVVAELLAAFGSGRKHDNRSLQGGSPDTEKNLDRAR